MFDELIFNFDLEESLFVGFDSAYNIVFEEIFDDFLGKLNNGFTSKGSAFLFIFVHIEVFHGIGWDIFTLIFGSILKCDFGLDSGKGFLNDLLKFVFDESWNEFGLCLHG